MIVLGIVGWLVCGVISWLILLREEIEDVGQPTNDVIMLCIPCLIFGLVGLTIFPIISWYQSKDWCFIGWLTGVLKKTIRVNQTGVEPSDLDSTGGS